MQEGSMLQACLNGGLSKAKHAGVPITPLELAADAVSVRRAGANELHIHVRDHEGVETLDPADLASTLDAVRNAVPGMAVGIGTGAWIAPGGRARHRNMQAWSVLPDYCSVNLKEEDAVDVIDLLHSRGIGIEAGLWSRQDAQRFVSEVQFDKCLRVLVEMTSNDEAEALTEAAAVLGVLSGADCKLPILLHGEGGSVWACVEEAARLGYSTRVGFEDGLHLPDGSLASSNAELVAAAAELMRKQARSV
jgi:uncharacterized protein (DUF849 family)